MLDKPKETNKQSSKAEGYILDYEIGNKVIKTKTTSKT